MPVNFFCERLAQACFLARNGKHHAACFALGEAREYLKQIKTITEQDRALCVFSALCAVLVTDPLSM
jgi:hypothetical protein